MNVIEFAKALEAAAPKDRRIHIDHYNQFSKTHETAHISWINLPKKMSHEAEVDERNNRLNIKVMGFPAKDPNADATTVKVELTARHGRKFDKLRSKTAAPEKIVKYIADYLKSQTDKEMSVQAIDNGKRTPEEVFGKSEAVEELFTPRQREIIQASATVDTTATTEEVDAEQARQHAATSQEEYDRIFAQLKPKQTLWLAYKTVMGMGQGDYHPYTVGRRSLSKKYNVTSIALARKGEVAKKDPFGRSPRLTGLSLLKRGDKPVGLAVGDMAASIIGMYLEK